MENYENFLTSEDDFRLAMEKYLPEFLERLNNDTLDDDDFKMRTIKMMEISEKAGIDLQQYIIDYGKMNGYME